MKLSLGFSSCPNDTFIFDALVNNRIDHPFDLDTTIADIAELNKMAFEGRLDVIKLSYHAFAYLTPTYQMLNTGSALGNGVGPLLIAKRNISQEDVPNCTIAIPGDYTSANFLMQFAFPDAKQKKSMIFSDIEKAVLNDEIDLGVIIHENRFTYQDRGLTKILDLGLYWEQQTQQPIPLGGIAIKRDLPLDIKQKFDQKLGQSIAHAFNNPEDATPFISQHAQDMDTKIMQNHIDLYVNAYSQDIGATGKSAVSTMIQAIAAQNPQIPNVKSLFVPK